MTSDNYGLVIFDLDGTLLDTSRGIFNSVRYAESRMGFRPAEEDELRMFVGPPPKEMYMKIHNADENSAMQAVTYHREYGRKKAIYEAEVYPGIEKLLVRLKEAGIKLAVSTLKSENIAEAILEHFGLAGNFDTVVGMDPQESRTKADTIGLAIEKTGADKSGSLMVGDSIYDLNGAAEAGIGFLGVTYGFGLKDVSETFPKAGSAEEIEKFILKEH